MVHLRQFDLFPSVYLKGPYKFQLRNEKSAAQIAKNCSQAVSGLGGAIIILLKSASSSQIKSICIALRRMKRVKLFSPGILQDSPLWVLVLR